MKHINAFFLLLAFFLCTFTLNAQHLPGGINYQAVLRDQQGQIIENKQINIQISVNDPEAADVFYIEQHQISTNKAGMFSLVIGEGRAIKGAFQDIPWATSNTWLEVAYDLENDGKYEITGTTRMLSVPYAFYAEKAGSTLGKSDQHGNADGDMLGEESAWLLKGNKTVDDTYMFLGTTNYADLVIKTHDQERIRITKGFATDSHDALINLQEDVTADKSVTVGEMLTVGKFTLLNDELMVISNTAVGGKLDVAGNTTVGGTMDIAKQLDVHQDVVVDGGIDVQDDSEFEGKVKMAKDLDVNGNILVEGNADIGIDLHVGNDVDIDNTLTVDSHTFVGGNTYLNQNLFVVNNTEIGGDTHIEGNTTIEQNLDIDVDVHIGQDLTVVRNATINNNLFVENNAFFNGDLSVDGEGTFYDLIVENDLDVQNNVDIDHNLTAGGKVKFTDDLNSFTKDDGAVVIENGGVGIEKNLNIGGDFSALGKGKFDGHLETGGNLHVKGLATIDEDMFVLGKTNLNGELRVMKAAQFDGNVGIDENVFIEGTMKVNKAVTLENNLDVAGTLEVDGSATFYESAIFSKGLSISGSAFGGDAMQFSDYPLRIDNTDQGVGIRVSNASGDKHFLSFFDEFSMRGRIEGQTLNELTTSYEYIWANAMSVAELALKIAMVAACIAQADVGEVIVWGAEGAVQITKWTEWNVNKVNKVGVSYESGSGDYAEWLERADPFQALQYGEVVGVRGGKIDRNTQDADHLMVVSMAPIVLGNMPEAGREQNFEKVAFMGQVPVRVMGKVAVGDYILPTGNNDGLGKAVKPADMRIEDYPRIVGVAWQAGESALMNFVNVAVGINANDVAARVSQQQRELDAMKQQINQLFAMIGQKLPYEGLENAPVAAAVAPASAVAPAAKAALSTAGLNQIFENSRAAIEEVFAKNRAELEKQGADLNKFPEIAAVYNNPVQWMKDQHEKGYLDGMLGKKVD